MDKACSTNEETKNTSIRPRLGWEYCRIEAVWEMSHLMDKKKIIVLTWTLDLLYKMHHFLTYVVVQTAS